MTAWRPRQCVKDWASSYEYIGGGVTQSILRHCLELAPPITTGSTILDNACGTGLGVEEVMKHAQRKTPSSAWNIFVSGTDHDPSMIAILDAKIQRYDWHSNVRTFVMDSQSLEFPTNHFSHSITNFAIFMIPDHVGAAAEIYRTLKPGGTALVTTWAELGHGNAVAAASRATRPEVDTSRTGMPPEWYTPSHLRRVMEAGGFAASKVQMSQYEDHMSVMDLDDWAQHAWTWFGRPPGGWKQRDEDLWPEAIAAYVDSVKKSKGFHFDEQTGAACVRVVANVAVATK